MANVFIEENILKGWADTVREKTGTTDKMLPSALLQQTQTNWGTGGGDSGNNGLVLVGALPTPLYSGSSNTDTVNAYVYVDVPADATILSAYVVLECKTTNNSFKESKKETTTFHYDGKSDLELISVTDGLARYKLFDFSYTPPSSDVFVNNFTVRADGASSCVCIVPSAYMENGILYADENCVSPFGYNNYHATVPREPLYIEGLDLRGSQVTSLPMYCLDRHTELKKVWFSEVFAKLNSYIFQNCGNIEELHFTSATPPTASYTSWYTGVPNTCKIYVPAGTLSAYTSAANYPNASTYTYIEE